MFRSNKLHSRPIWLSLISSICLLALLVSCNSSSEDKPHQEAPLKGSESFHAVRNFPKFDQAAEGFLQALTYSKAQSLVRGTPPYGFDTPWVSRGPDNIGGRINTIAQHPQQPNTFLAGLVAGGIFKTIDGGNSWYPVFDQMPVLSISKIVFDPSEPNTVYAATGDPNISSYVFIGLGLYKSQDAGETWISIGLEEAGILNAFAIDPQDNKKLYAGSMGIALRHGDERGFYRSMDGGTTWEKTLFLSDEAGITDILIDPEDPKTVYASGWHRVRNQAVTIVNGPLSRLYRSQDYGLTWDTLTNGLPTGPQSRTGLAWSQGSLFLQVVGTDQQLQGIYRSDDQGNTWTTIPLQGLMGNELGGFGWYFGKLRVNPKDKNDIFLLGVDLWRTRNGGFDWEAATPPWWTYEVHADKHDLLFTPNGALILATDGGIYWADEDAFQWFRIDNIPATQFYRIAYNMHDADLWVGGAQDNGTTGGYSKKWNRYYGGDGFQPAFHPEFPSIFYAETQNGNLVVSTNGGIWFNEFNYGIDTSDNVGWDAPFFISEHPPHTLYFGTNRVYENSSPFLANWVPISGMLTDPMEPYLERTHVLTALGESASLPGFLLAGTGDGRLWKREPFAPEWVNITPGLPEQYVTSCQGSAASPDRIFVTHSGYRYNTFVPHVHRSDDKGETWISINGDLPPFGVNDLVVVPGYGDSILFVGTDAGVYGSVNGGLAWFPLLTGMPAVPVYDIAWNPELNLLMAGTHARSFFTLALDAILDPPVSLNELNSLSPEWTLFPNPGLGSYLYLQQKKGDTKPIRVNVYNQQGIPIHEIKTPNYDGVIKIPVDSWQNGVYFITVGDGKNQEVYKWVLSR